MNDHPRLLFVTPHAFNHVTGGGVAFSNLFRGWPQDRIATVHNDSEPTSDDVCRLYYRLGPAELDFIEPFASARRLIRRDAPSMPGGGEHATAGAPQGGAKAAVKRIAVNLLGPAFPERAALTPELERWIGDFRPDVLYTILGSNGMMALIEKILERFDLPFVVHIMDDWPAAAHRQGLLAGRERRVMERHLDRLLSCASECLAISSAMAEAYARRYGRPFRAFQNAIDVARWEQTAKRDLSVGRPAELLYVGSIFPNAQLDSLTDCAEAVASLSSSGYPVKLTISTPSGHADRYRARLAIHPAIAIEDTIRDDARFFARIAAADALLIPVNFDADSLRFIRYSMPAKLPAYMVSATPILVYGDPAAAQVQYAATAGWGHVVQARDRALLTEGIRTIMEGAGLRRQVSAAAAATVRRHHDATRVRTDFHATLAHAAGCRAAAAVR
jgi:hypothetical protein